MGDRTWWFEDCPKCNKKNAVEVYDAPSSLIFSRQCGECNWTDGLDYYEKGDTLYLLSKEEAKEKGF
jgi:hypothetical protein